MKHHKIEDWDGVRVAAEVAKAGSISKAAKRLSIHRNTVNRYVEALEAQLGGKLFQRHSHGVTLTDLGTEMVRIAEATQSQFGDLYRRARESDQPLTGRFVITSLDVLAPLILPLVTRFAEAQPDLDIHYITSDQKLRLAYGEADVAFRIGPEPTTLDNVVRHFASLEMAVYATEACLERYQMNRSQINVGMPPMIGPTDQTPNAPFVNWMRENLPSTNIQFRALSIDLMWRSVTDGHAAGFLPKIIAKKRSGLVEIETFDDAFKEDVWLITHVDLHRSAKVQAFLSIVKDRNE